MLLRRSRPTFILARKIFSHNKRPTRPVAAVADLSSPFSLPSPSLVVRRYRKIDAIRGWNQSTAKRNGPRKSSSDRRGPGRPTVFCGPVVCKILQSQIVHPINIQVGRQPRCGIAQPHLRIINTQPTLILPYSVEIERPCNDCPSLESRPFSLTEHAVHARRGVRSVECYYWLFSITRLLLPIVRGDLAVSSSFLRPRERKNVSVENYTPIKFSPNDSAGITERDEGGREARIIVCLLPLH